MLLSAAAWWIGLIILSFALARGYWPVGVLMSAVFSVLIVAWVLQHIN